jgi:ABC-type microcin C transport system duplicated ATPase subunit YejF
MPTTLLDVQDLSVRFETDDGAAQAVDRFSFALGEREVLGIVGESGCGKSVTMMSLLRLLPQTAVVTGSALFGGIDLLAASSSQLGRIRGREISFVFQEPMTSLNPAFTIGDQIVEGLRRHKGLGPAAAAERAVAMLEKVRIPAPAQRFHEHPHQLSGGMRQRAMIAMRWPATRAC